MNNTYLSKHENFLNLITDTFNSIKLSSFLAAGMVAALFVFVPLINFENSTVEKIRFQINIVLLITYFVLWGLIIYTIKKAINKVEVENKYYPRKTHTVILMLFLVMILTIPTGFEIFNIELNHLMLEKSVIGQDDYLKILVISLIRSIINTFIWLLFFKILIYVSYFLEFITSKLIKGEDSIVYVKKLIKPVLFLGLLLTNFILVVQGFVKYF